MAKLGFNPRENLGFLLAKAAQRWNEALYEQFCVRGYADVRPAYGSILIPLFEEDGLHMGELARRARLSKQTMTTLIATMERKGLIKRSRDVVDKRAFRVYLTKRSQRFMSVAKDVLEHMDGMVEGRISQPRVEELRDALKVLMEMDGPSTQAADGLVGVPEAPE